MADNARAKPSTKATAPKDPEPGHLEVDDRGNVTWQWTDEGDLLADDTLGAAERVRALVDPSLEVREEEISPVDPIRSNPKGLTVGYNPYNSGILGKSEWKRKKNLRELSEWIKLRKRVGSDKPGED